MRVRCEWPPGVLDGLCVCVYRGLESTHLAPRHRVLQQHQVGEFREAAQRLQIRQLADLVLGEDEGVQVRYRPGQRRLHARDAVARQQERLQARAEREVGEVGDVVVREVDAVLVLPAVQHAEVAPVRGGGPLR